MLERDEETEDTKAKIQQLQDKIDQHDKEYPMKSFHTKDTVGNKRKCLDRGADDRGAGGGAGDIGATDCAELRAHGYEVKPRVEEVVDESRGVMKLLSKVLQPLSTYAPR